MKNIFILLLSLSIFGLFSCDALDDLFDLNSPETETGTETETETETVAFLAMANTKYISVENEGNSPLIANSSYAGNWELFYLINNSDGTISIRAKENN